ncbi:acyltransferase family protein [Rouxiella silvae]|uniref:Acyltransferase family protein n=1 Tax=Rouxiella silvae TaxID=1646373 RepID=A0AA40X088_9GAMM|nr:acyltransferase family protein [Rouxiella silvae]MBF6636231.1 acyltransferase family protein [Rouxiella silvae]
MKNIMYSPRNDQWVDTSKGIAILLVIAGHVFSGFLSNAIFLFHMPFFFFLSGILLKPQPPGNYFLRKTPRLISPYIFYAVIFFILSLFYFYHNGQFSLLKVVHSMEREVVGGRFLTGWQSVFWFIPVFCISQQLLNFVLSRVSAKAASAVMLVMLTIAYIDSYFVKVNVPLNLSAVLYATPLMYIGYYLKIKNINISKYLLVLISIISIAMVYFWPDLFKVDMKYAFYGMPVVGAISALCMSLLIINFSKNLSKGVGFLSFVGVNSMIIMYIHQFIRLELANRITSNELICFIITAVLSVLFCLFIHIIKNSNARVGLILSKTVG